MALKWLASFYLQNIHSWTSNTHQILVIHSHSFYLQVYEMRMDISDYSLWAYLPEEVTLSCILSYYVSVLMYVYVYMYLYTYDCINIYSLIVYIIYTQIHMLLSVVLYKIGLILHIFSTTWCFSSKQYTRNHPHIIKTWKMILMNTLEKKMEMVIKHENSLKTKKYILYIF